MKIVRISFGRSIARIHIRADNGDNLGVWETANPAFIEALKLEPPNVLAIRSTMRRKKNEIPHDKESCVPQV